MAKRLHERSVAGLRTENASVLIRGTLSGAVVMAPMTKGSNLPYRQLCVELGARVTVSEMTLARRLKQRRHSEFALIRRFPGEPCFGVQLAEHQARRGSRGRRALVEARGADFVDVNFGCPIDYFTRKGLGAAIGRQPNRIRRLVEAIKRAVTSMPVTAKIRLGWNDEHAIICSRRRRPSTAAPTRCSFTVERGTRATASRPIGMRSAR